MRFEFGIQSNCVSMEAVSERSAGISTEVLIQEKSH